MHATPTPSDARWKVACLCLGLGAATAVLLVWSAAMRLGPIDRSMSKPLVLSVLFVGFAAIVAFPISVHYRGDTFLFVLTEIPLLLGLAFISPIELVLVRLAGEAIGLGLVRRQTPLKLVFNLVSGALATAAAALVFHAAIDHNSAVSPLGSAAAVAALAAAALMAQVAVHVVVRLNGERIPRRTRFEVGTALLIFGASAGLALVVLDAAWFDRWAMVPLIIVGIIIVFAYRGYSRLTQRFGALERLYEFSDSLTGVYLEPSVASPAVLGKVETVMRARRAQLVLLEGDGLVLVQELAGSEVREPEHKELPEGSIVARSLATDRAILRPNTPGAPADEPDPVVGAYRDAVVSPLRAGDRVVGALVALDRDEALDTFDSDDLRLFEALAAHAVSTLEQARLVDELRLEAASKLHQATHDALTGLPNRALFLSQAASSLAAARQAAVALLDIDHFKDVNDTLGHDMGDRLLLEVAARLARAAEGRATVARLGGDEFAIIVTDLIGPEEAIGIIRDLHVAISRPVDVDGLPLAVTASAGVALAPGHGSNVTALLQGAEIAMYSAKERRSSIEVYSPGRDQRMQRRLMLGGQLVRAIENGELEVMYQPIADLKTGKVLRVEALARWHHAEHGWIPTSEFIDIAEQIGLIGRITEFVLVTACGEAARWREDGLQIGLAVNLSGRALTDEPLLGLVSRVLETNGIPAQSLTLELTETEVMTDLGEASAVLTRLAQLGPRIAVDDYGTGYSSLAYLHRLPVQELKIDRSFVTNLVDDPSNRIIVRSSIAMAHSLGLTVVAEGAEDEVTCAILADAGCDAVQGYYFSRPQRADALAEWLASGAELRFSRELPPLRPLRVVEGEPAPGSDRDDQRRGRQV